MSTRGEGQFHQPAGEGSDSCVRVAAHLGLRALLGEGGAAPSNFAFSPLSLRAALGLVAVGSGGKTLEQLLSFLGLSHVEGTCDPRLAAGNVVAAKPRSSPPMRHPMASTLRLLDRDSEGGATHTSFVSGVWLDQKLTFSQAFKEVATTIHGAKTESLDFLNKASEARRDINRWAEKETNGVIKEFLPEGAITNRTKVVVANALFFHGAWLEPFDRTLTFDSEFYLLGGGSVRVPFMSTTTDHHMTVSAFDDGLKVLKLPYKVQPGSPVLIHSRFSMYIFLPGGRDGLRHLTEEVASDPSFLGRHLAKEIVRAGTFMLPKFEASWGTCDASGALRDLGLPLLFSGEAQLDRLASEGSHQCKLGLSAVFHKAAVKVDEEGTEAAAVTACEYVGCSMFEPPVVDFVADHPFLFIITEDDSEHVVFYGHVAIPSLE